MVTKRRFLICILLIISMVLPVGAEPIKWVDFGVPYESMKYALDQDIATFDQEKHISWIDILALAAESRKTSKSPNTFPLLRKTSLCRD